MANQSIVRICGCHSLLLIHKETSRLNKTVDRMQTKQVSAGLIIQISGIYLGLTEMNRRFKHKAYQ